MSLTVEQRKRLVHVRYEWRMFQACAEILRKLVDDPDPVTNALIESLAIHGRNLINFFYNGAAVRVPKPRLANKPPKPGDISAMDFGIPMPAKAPKPLATWKTNADQRIAHLTERRLKPLRMWKTGKVRELLAKRIDKLKTAVGATLWGNGDEVRPTRWSSPTYPASASWLYRVGWTPTSSDGTVTRSVEVGRFMLKSGSLQKRRGT